MKTLKRILNWFKKTVRNTVEGLTKVTALGATGVVSIGQGLLSGAVEVVDLAALAVYRLLYGAGLLVATPALMFERTAKLAWTGYFQSLKSFNWKYGSQEVSYSFPDNVHHINEKRTA